MQFAQAQAASSVTVFELANKSRGNGLVAVSSPGLIAGRTSGGDSVSGIATGCGRILSRTCNHRLPFSKDPWLKKQPGVSECAYLNRSPLLRLQLPNRLRVQLHFQIRTRSGRPQGTSRSLPDTGGLLMCFETLCQDPASLICAQLPDATCLLAFG